MLLKSTLISIFFSNDIDGLDHAVLAVGYGTIAGQVNCLELCNTA